jgi:hypothetical protein
MYQHPTAEKWSKMGWPNKRPTKSNFQLWRSAVQAICPSWQATTQVGPFIAPTHKIWRWTWDCKLETLHCLRDDGENVDVFVLGWKPNRFHFSCQQPRSNTNTLCLVEPTHACSGWRLTSLVCMPAPPQTPWTFLDVLHSWGSTWLWDNLSISGEVDWTQDAIIEGTLVAVMDGLYIPELYPNLTLQHLYWNAPKAKGE